LSSGERFIFDGGTGLRELSAAWSRSAHAPSLVRIFLTHFHWDHIQGIPYFEPLFSPSATVEFRSSRQPEEARAILSRQMSSPFFPVEFSEAASRTQFVRDDVYVSDSVNIRAFALNHPQGACGYRIEHGGRSIVYASDLEHGNPPFDLLLRQHAEGADVLIYDAQYTPEEYETHRGWGHSTWREAVRVARECSVGRLFLFHHDPMHTDEFMDRYVAAPAAEAFARTETAREGETICV
jgi:phosphoribosyl 1,2-cyclic phosphodiesterase